MVPLEHFLKTGVLPEGAIMYDTLHCLALQPKLSEYVGVLSPSVLSTFSRILIGIFRDKFLLCQLGWYHWRSLKEEKTQKMTKS